ncbi:hypothetical protein P3X46_010467 [Hevea brasiliensis]|uniref:Aspartic peptidase DDI1-type domain-containing protein n=1 Tax=Hevea brasiliensis TaxID=3981 RepID=A0ABQ9MF80_HEVBR|nr:hypothetical protein P3X46_010467 [Hevea brasiliensis]
MSYVNNRGNLNQRQPNNPYSNTYNPGWRNHPNFSWSNQQNQPINKQHGYKPPAPPGFQNRGQNFAQPSLPLQPQQPELKMTMETMMEGFLAAQQQQNELIKQLTSRMDQLAPHNKMLENQITQQASSSSKVAGKLPSQPEMNPREHCKAITLRSGRTLVQPEKLYINIPFTEALSQMPSYAKFLKEILLKKRKPEDYETVALTKECSVILQNKLPPKLKDPGNKALGYFGASVSLMPLSICKKLEIGELTPTTISLQLADRSVKYPVGGIHENIPIKMEEDVQIPIILGRPFLATVRAIIDVKNGRLTLKVGEEEVEFNLFDTMKHKFEPNECFKVDIIDKQVKEEFHKTHPKDPLKACIVHSHTMDDENLEIAVCAQQLAAHPPLPLAKASEMEKFKEEQTKVKLQENAK